MSKFTNFVKTHSTEIIVSGIAIAGVVATAAVTHIVTRGVLYGIDVEREAAFDVILDLGGNLNMVDDKIMQNLADIIKS